MKGLQAFSVRGLRKFQNLLFIAGFLLVPIVFFVDTLMVQYVLSLSFIGIFWGFRKAEKIISLKIRQKTSKQKEDIGRLNEQCIQSLRHMEGIFIKKGYSIKRNENEILNRLYGQLDSCSTITDYLSLKEQIENRLSFVSSISNNKQEKKEKKQHQQKKQSERTAKTASFHTLSKSFEILGLPEGTKDIVVIKNAYKKLIKQYHPDINPSLEAGEKTVELNLAYEQLKKNIAS